MIDIRSFNFDPDSIRQLKIGELKIGNTVVRNVEYDSSDANEVKAFQQLVTDLGKVATPEPQALNNEGQALLGIITEERGRLREEREASKAQPTTQGLATNKLSDVFPKYLDRRRKSGINERSLEDYQTTNRLLIEVIGDKPVDRISKDDANYFVETIMQLPPNRNKVAAYRNKPIHEVIKIRQRLEEEETKRRQKTAATPGELVDFSMSVRTVDKHIACCSAFFNWTIEKGFSFGNNVFSKQKVQTMAQRESDTEESRQPFDSSDLQAIFSPANYETRVTPHDYWFPLIAVYSGLRLNEIAQLYIKDIYYDQGIWAFDINKNSADKRLKTKTSKRLVPIHPALIDMGFLDYVEDIKRIDKDRLFPHLAHHGRGGYGVQPGRNFATYLTSLKITAKEKVFHSFRHTFGNTLKQLYEVSEEGRSELMGHAHRNINADVYSTGHRLPNKLGFMRQLAYKEVQGSLLRYQKGQFDKFMQLSLNPVIAPQDEEKMNRHREAQIARKQRALEAGKPIPPHLRDV